LIKLAWSLFRTTRPEEHSKLSKNCISQRD